MSEQERRFKVGELVQMEIEEGFFVSYVVMEVLPKMEKGWDYQLGTASGAYYAGPCLDRDLIPS